MDGTDQQATPSSETQDIFVPEALYAVIHHVDCDGRGAHSGHPETTTFLDRPRLYAGDNKASQLRGKKHLDDEDDYIDQQEGLCMVVHKYYSCMAYHEHVKKSFTQVKIPKKDATVSPRVWPYLFTLLEDVELALCEEENMSVLSSDMRMWLHNLDPALDLLDPSETTNEIPEMLRIDGPYMRLYHRRKEMNEFISNTEEQEQKQSMMALRSYLETEFGDDHAEADSLFAVGRVSKKHFAKLFGPNQVLVAMQEDQPRAYVCTGFQGTFPSLIVQCWTWDFDGHFRKQNTDLNVNWPSETDDTVPVTDLTLYPLRLDQTGLEDRLQKRGKSFWQFRALKYVSYQTKNPTFEIRTSNPRFMIDMNTYRQLHALDANKPAEKDTLSAGEMSRNDILEGDFALLLPSTILGFGFHDKKWRTLQVEHIVDVKWNDTAFDRLVLDEDKKEIIQALITVHTETAKTTDLIEGKGNGLVMLLHGSPGTGKTLTAESVAELTEKPLYRVTCGDMGTNPESVEKYLESVFHIGTIWNCVVLLDEADVFLEERSDADLERNALVSVFLRAVEYYDGILILTSNRVGRFDEAFKSRIQLAVHYPSLDRDSRLEIWSKFVHALVGEEDPHMVNELNGNIPLLAQHELNGRQIRNMIKTARQLAYYKREKLRYGHFKRVIKIANEFESYIVETRGGYTDAQLAAEQNLRAG